MLRCTDNTICHQLCFIFPPNLPVQVNAAWAGLGYYRRARYLLEGAQYVVAEHGGVFPRTSRELQKIPGMSVHSCTPPLPLPPATLQCWEGRARPAY